MTLQTVLCCSFMWNGQISKALEVYACMPSVHRLFPSPVLLLALQLYLYPYLHLSTSSCTTTAIHLALTYVFRHEEDDAASGPGVLRRSHAYHQLHPPTGSPPLFFRRAEAPRPEGMYLNATLYLYTCRTRDTHCLPLQLLPEQYIELLLSDSQDAINENWENIVRSLNCVKERTEENAQLFSRVKVHLKKLASNHRIDDLKRLLLVRRL